MSFQCPICGYNRLKEPPEDFSICPCCGTEFGFDDFEVSHDQLRDRWIANGMPWFSRYTLPPINWNPVTQLSNLGQLRNSKPQTQVVRRSLHSTDIHIDVCWNGELNTKYTPSYA